MEMTAEIVEHDQNNGNNKANSISCNQRSVGVHGLKEGNYRLGIWVNSNKAFEENPNDNAMLFKGELSFKPAVQAVKTTEEKKEQTPVEEKVDQEKTTDENWEVEFTPKIKAPKVAKKKKKK